MANPLSLERTPLVEGKRTTVYALARNGKSEILEFVHNLQHNDPDASVDLQNELQYIANNFPVVRGPWFSKLNEWDIYVVKRGRARLYGFKAKDGLYLCRYDLKQQRNHDRNICASVRRQGKEWSEQYGS
jgi:hypothetical protein